MLGQELSVPDSVTSFVKHKRCGANEAVEEKCVIAVGEMKRRNFVFDEDETASTTTADFVDICRRKTHTADGICQIVGYCVEHKCKYAFLSICEWTWALRLGQNGILDTSPPYCCSSTGSEAVLTMMYVIIDEELRWTNESEEP
jgi:hypothetical protein